MDEMPQGLELSPQQEQAMFRLAAGESATVIARSIGKTEQTLSQWKNTPAFAVALNAERERLSENHRKTNDEIAELASRVRRKSLQVLERELDSEDSLRAFRAACAALRKT